MSLSEFFFINGAGCAVRAKSFDLTLNLDQHWAKPVEQFRDFFEFCELAGKGLKGGSVFL